MLELSTETPPLQPNTVPVPDSGTISALSGKFHLPAILPRLGGQKDTGIDVKITQNVIQNHDF